MIKIPLEQHLNELKECRRIFREIQPHIDIIKSHPSNTRYTPYTLSYEEIANAVHEIREILRNKIERG